MKTRYKLLTLFLCALLAVSCGTKKHVASTAPTEAAVSPSQGADADRSVPAYVTARLSSQLSRGDESVSVGGMLRMKRDDVIQISLVTFGILEVARIEMTPDYFMLIDKMGKQYVKAAYSDVPFLRDARVDFRTIQTYFWDEQTSSLTGWERKDFVNVGGKNFPTKHRITIPNGSKTIKAELSLSNLNTDSDWETRTTVSSRYTQVPVDELLEHILKR